MTLDVTGKGKMLHLVVTCLLLLSYAGLHKSPSTNENTDKFPAILFTLGQNVIMSECYHATIAY